MENENRTFRLKSRGTAIALVVSNTLLALFMLILTIARFSTGVRGGTFGWINSWWVAALLFGAFVFLAVKSLRDVFVQLTLSQEGIWYHQLGSKQFISWEQVECVGMIPAAFRTGKQQYYLILTSALKEDQKTFFGMKQDTQEIPLSVFVNQWLGSDLRNEIKRLRPSLPMEDGLRNM